MTNYDHNMGRKKLFDILHNVDDLRDLWNQTEPAKEFSPLPKGSYVAHIVKGELFESRRGTPGYKLTFEVCEGPYAGRRFWADFWLTERAIEHTRRDLEKLGITAFDQLRQPLRPGIRVLAEVVLHQNDDGAQYNRVRSFTVLGYDEPETDVFAPTDNPPATEGNDDNGEAEQ